MTGLSMGEEGTHPTFLFRGGEVLGPAGLEKTDLLVAQGVIAAIGEAIEAPSGTKLVDASGHVVLPGLVDIHCHTRQPGFEESETLESASRAAALGGYTAIVAMPNTEPAIDSVPMVSYIRDLAKSALCEVFPAGAITVGRKGEKLAPIAEMFGAGVRLFTDDGAGVQDPLLARRAMEYMAALGATYAEHCEDERLANRGVMNEGAVSSELGVPGIPPASEEVMAARDLILARLTGVKLHLLHISTAQTLSMVETAKKAGLDVTCEVTPHHLMLTDSNLRAFDSVFKVNPPLREQADVDSLVQACFEGTVDAIATDHAPHSLHSKETTLDAAPFGMIGLQTAFGVASKVLGSGNSSLLVRLLSTGPAKIAGIERHHGGALHVGRTANLCVVDPNLEWNVLPEEVASKSKNTPFGGIGLEGKVVHTFLRGEPTVLFGEAQR